jgi:hypothetical protein
MPKPPPRCEHCRAFFPRKHPLQKYCGVQCRSRAFIVRRRERIETQRKNAPFLGFSRRCKHCGKSFFIGKDSRGIQRRDARFCSNACRQAKWRYVHNPKKTDRDDARQVAKASEGVLNPGQVRILRALRSAGRRELNRKELKRAAGIGAGSKNIWALVHHKPPLIFISQYEPERGKRAHHEHSITADGRKVLERAEGLSPLSRIHPFSLTSEAILGMT